MSAGNGADLITDFERGPNSIGLSGGLTFEDLSFAGNSILLDDSQEILATVAEVDTITLTADDFLTI